MSLMEPVTASYLFLSALAKLNILGAALIELKRNWTKDYN